MKKGEAKRETGRKNEEKISLERSKEDKEVSVVLTHDEGSSKMKGTALSANTTERKDGYRRRIQEGQRRFFTSRKHPKNRRHMQEEKKDEAKTTNMGEGVEGKRKDYHLLPLLLLSILLAYFSARTEEKK